MSPVGAEIVELDALAQTALAALLGGVGVTLAFSLAILGTTKASDLRRAGRDVAAALSLGLGLLALALSIAAVAFGLVVMVSD